MAIPRESYIPVARKYDPVEFCISLHSKTRDRIQEGDIVYWRPLEINRTGVDLTKRYLLIPVEGFDHWSMVNLNFTGPMTNVDNWMKHPIRVGNKPGGTEITYYDKRRFCIPLHRLKQVYPALDLARCRDENDIYQPFRQFCFDRGYFITTVKPFNLHGLVFDKFKGKYL